VIDHIAGCSVCLLDRDRIVCLRRAVVIDEYDSSSDADGDFPNHAIVSVSVPQDPAAPVHIHHDRQGSGDATASNDPYRHRSGGADREDSILDLRTRLANRYRL
jgi:hypothetical protein